MMWSRARARAMVAVGTLSVSGLLSACNSPTLPTPPPVVEALNVPRAELIGDGQEVALSGQDALPFATIVIVNRNLVSSDIDNAFSGTIADGAGHYAKTIRVDLRCARTNAIEIWQRNDMGQDSLARRFDAPNDLGDASLPPSGGAACTDSGIADDGGGDAGAGAEGGD